MNCEQCLDRLGDAVDDTLTVSERAQVDAHCRSCEACRFLLADLHAIRTAAATLERPVPRPDVWHAITGAVASPMAAAPRPLVRVAAAAALAATIAAAAWLDFRPRATEAPAAGLAQNAATELQLAEQHYESAVASLERLTAERDAALDPGVAAQIARSLRSIDQAITASRAALATEPGSAVAQTSLLEALRMKVALLQETVSLMNSRS